MALTLLFKLGASIYGLEIDSVQEIIESPVRYFAPLAEGVLKSAINFHGQVLAVIDLPELLDFSGKQHDHRLVVLAPHCRSMVLLVTEVERIVNLDLSVLEPPSEKLQDKAVRGIIEFEDSTVNILDTEKIINLLDATYAG